MLLSEHLPTHRSALKNRDAQLEAATERIKELELLVARWVQCTLQASLTPTVKQASFTPTVQHEGYVHAAGLAEVASQQSGTPRSQL
jgi:hypothetical protein